MGGAETEMGDSTRNVLVEAANWDPVSIARTARRHKLPSEAAKRYERGVDPEIAATAVSRVAQLMVDLAGGTADLGGSLIHEAPARTAILLPDGYVSGLIGVEYTRRRGARRPRRDRRHRDPRRGRVRGRAAVVAARSHRQGRARRGGGSARRLPPHPLGAAGRSSRSRPDPVAADPTPGRRHARGRRLDRGAVVPVRHRGRERRVRQRRRRARGIRSPRERARRRAPRSCAGRCCPGSSPRRSATARAGSSTCRSSSSAACSCPRPAATYGSAELPDRRRAAERRGPRDPAGGHPAAAAPRRRAHRRRRRDEAARTGAASPRGIVDALDAVRQVALARRRRASRSCRARTRRCTRAARPSSGSPAARSAIAGELLPALAEEADLPRVVAVAELDLDAVIELTEPGPRGRPDRHLPGRDAGPLARWSRPTCPPPTVAGAVREGAGELLEHLELVDDYRGAGRARGLEEPHVRPALPRRGPHADGGRGERGEARRRRGGRRAHRRGHPGVAPAARSGPSDARPLGGGRWRPEVRRRGAR